MAKLNPDTHVLLDAAAKIYLRSNTKRWQVRRSCPSQKCSHKLMRGQGARFSKTILRLLQSTSFCFSGKVFITNIDHQKIQ